MAIHFLLATKFEFYEMLWYLASYAIYINVLVKEYIIV